MKLKRLNPWFTLIATIGVLAAPSPDSLIIEETYNAWATTVDAKDIEAWSSFLAPEPYFVPPGVAPLDTREAVLDYYSAAFADPNFGLDCRQLAVEIAESGETAWANGVCHATFSDPEGNPAKGTSRWFKIWEKQDDGSWKCRVNTWNYEDDE